MPAFRAQQKAVSKYMKENYDVYQIRMPKGKKAAIQAHAAAQGESVNGFINRVIDQAMERDGGRMPSETAQQGRKSHLGLGWYLLRALRNHGCRSKGRRRLRGNGIFFCVPCG